MASANPDPALLRDLGQKAQGGGTLTPDEAVALYRGLDQPSLGLLANDVRLRLNPPGEDGKLRVTYIVDRNLNPTNVCVTDCGFCAFYRSPDDAEAYILPREVIYQKVDELVEHGGRQLLLQGGHHPKLKTDWYAELFRDLKERYPDLWIHGMSPPEITHISASWRSARCSDVLAGPQGGRPRLDPRRRRRDPRRARAPDHRAEEGDHRRVARRHAPVGPHGRQGHRDDDVRPLRDRRRAHRAHDSASASCRTRPTSSPRSSRGRSSPSTHPSATGCSKIAAARRRPSPSTCAR